MRNSKHNKLSFAKKPKVVTVASALLAAIAMSGVYAQATVAKRLPPNTPKCLEATPQQTSTSKTSCVASQIKRPATRKGVARVPQGQGVPTVSPR
jgi:hypothetical protein